MMNRLIIVFSVTLLLVVPRLGFGAVESIAAGVSVSAVIAEVRDSIKEIVDKLQAEASLLSFDVRSDLIVTSENLQRLALEFEGKVFQDLNAVERKAITDVRAAIAQFQDGNKGALESLDASIAALGTEMTRIPGISKDPYVTGVRPTYFVAAPDGSVELHVKGSSLGRSSTALKFGDVDCALLAATELTFRYRCPVSKMWEGSAEWAVGSLSIDRKNQWWRFWGDDVHVAYPISVRRIDPVLGRVVADAKVQKKIRTTIDRSDDSRWVRCGPCGSEEQIFRYSPTRGCRIDVESVTARAANKSSKSEFSGVSNLDSHGFTVRVKAIGSGEKVFGKCVGGGRGAVRPDVRWKDVCDSVEDGWARIPTPDHVRWGSDYLIDLPDNAKGFRIKVTQANGSTKQFTSTDETEWLTVDFDQTGGTVKLRPKKLEDAFK